MFVREAATVKGHNTPLAKFWHQHKEKISETYCETLLKTFRHQHKERISEMVPSTFAKVWPTKREKEKREQPPPPAPGLSVPQYHDLSTPPPLPKFSQWT